MNRSTRRSRGSLTARRIVLWTLTVLALTAADARAQQLSMGSFRGYLTGHVGAITAGELDDARPAAGVSVSVHEGTGWGAELDFGHGKDASSGRQLLDVTSYMVNAAWARPAGFIRPFGSGGVGIVQIDGCDTPCNRPARTYDFGLSAGGGVFVAPHDAFALRADLRYFFTAANHRDLNRPDNFNYWRISIGATYIWAIAP